MLPSEGEVFLHQLTVKTIPSDMLTDYPDLDNSLIEVLYPDNSRCIKLWLKITRTTVKS